MAGGIGKMQPTADESKSTPATPAEPLPEQIGRYRILARLGAGGMGTVYKAHDPQLDRVVALKLPRFDGPQHDRTTRVQRFQREARAAAQVFHPHVCPIFDVGDYNGQPYVVMAYVEGRSLAERLASERRFEDVTQAVVLIRQVLDALEAVHARGIIHRDLKPGNIMIDQAGRAILTDFGLARPENDVEHLTSDGVIVGTPAYMAPEQAAGQAERIGPWTDLYSLGVVLFQMLTGRLPFEGPGMTVFAKILQEPAPPPSTLRTDLDPSLEEVVRKALAKDTAERYQNTRQLAEALDDWVRNHPPQHFPPGEGRTASVLPIPGDSQLLPVQTQTAAVASGRPRRQPRRPRFWPTMGCFSLFAALALIPLFIFLASHGGCTPTTAKATAGTGVKTVAPIQRPKAMDYALLAKAAEEGNLAQVEKLCLEGCELDARDQNGETAFMKAASKGRLAVVKWFLNLQEGTLQEVQNRLQLLGAGKGKASWFSVRIKTDAFDNKGETALMKAAANGHLHVVEAMLAVKSLSFALNEKDDKGETALMKAKANGHLDIVKILKEAGAKE
jgi:tRNA A-37 threonylcarbamoyl transferase component Bud32